MPVGSTKLHDGAAFAAVTASLRLANDSSTGLRWRDDYIAQRAAPGAEAGFYDDRTGHYQVSAKGWPLYARHAVWMLANNQPVPKDSEVVHEDKNRKNLDPSNLVLVDKIEAARDALLSSGSKMNRAEALKRDMPRAASIRLDYEYGASETTRQPWFTLEVSQAKRRDNRTLFQTEDANKIAHAGGYSAVLFGFASDPSKVNISRLTDYDKDRIVRACASVWVPDGGVMTPQMKEIGREYIASLRESVTALAKGLGRE